MYMHAHLHFRVGDRIVEVRFNLGDIPLQILVATSQGGLYNAQQKLDTNAMTNEVS